MLLCRWQPLFKRRTWLFQESQESPSAMQIQSQDEPAKTLPWGQASITIFVKLQLRSHLVHWAWQLVGNGSSQKLACELLHTPTEQNIFWELYRLVTCSHRGLVVSWTCILAHPNASINQERTLHVHKGLSQN